jgi:diguanylate cyclase (GGDEF)-like protein
MLDVDGLKHANDTYGHQAGDELIRAVGRVLADAVRSEDVVARVGGDEFAVLLPGASEEECAGVAARIGRMLGRRRLPGIPVSASVGAATCEPGDDLERALRLADQRMYEVKDASRPPRAAADRRRT